MEQFLSEIETYAAASGISPQSVLRRSCAKGWGVWAAWKSGRSSPTLVIADRIRAWMAENPPADAGKVEAAE